MNTIERVYTLSRTRNISIYQLAQMSGISASTIRTCEKRGGELKIDTIERICGALGITLSEFFSQQDSADKEPPLTDGEIKAVRGLLGALERGSTGIR